MTEGPASNQGGPPASQGDGGGTPAGQQQWPGQAPHAQWQGPQGPPQGYMPSGQWPPGTAPPGYGHPYPYPVVVARGTNGMAIASLICAFACAPLGIIFGFIAKSQIKQTGEGGDGLATAGIAVGAAFIALLVVYFIFIFAVIGTAVHSIPFPTFTPAP